MPGVLPVIVVVEDDASMSQAIERILRAGGFTSVTFASAEVALDSDVATTASCLVIDIHLPGMSGFDLYRRLAMVDEEAPVIFITAHDEPAVREEVERMGACGYLPKPFSGRALLDAVTQAMAAD
jgi:FixJ family two-component response regulator